MTTEEHLNAIKSRCLEFLSIAEKRTPGKLSVNSGNFIASCAGPAEAGWRSTIAAINCIETMDGGANRHFMTQDIIAAWPAYLLENDK